MRTSAPVLVARLAWLAGVALAANAPACQRTKYTPTECTVWTEKDGSVTGTVYMRDAQASFMAGGARSNVAHLDGAGHVIVVSGAERVDAASFDGKTIQITYLTDARFVSEGFQNGTLTIASDLYRTEFYYNSLCTASDVAVGAVTLFTTIFPPGQPASL